MDNRESDSYHEARVGEDLLVDSDEGYQIVSSHIRNGEVVLMGDIHDRPDQHELFLNYMRKMSGEELDFSLALELPHQLTPRLPEMTAEMILSHASYYYALAGYEGLEESWKAGLLPILQFAKDKDIPVLCVDELRKKERTYYTGEANRSIDRADSKYRNTFMAQQLRQAKGDFGKPIFGMLGNSHTQLSAVPSLIDAFSVHIGEVNYAYKAFPRGAFDLQIKTDPHP